MYSWKSSCLVLCANDQSTNRYTIWIMVVISMIKRKIKVRQRVMESLCDQMALWCLSEVEESDLQTSWDVSPVRTIRALEKSQHDDFERKGPCDWIEDIDQKLWANEQGGAGTIVSDMWSHFGSSPEWRKSHWRACIRKETLFGLCFKHPYGHCLSDSL